MRVSTIHALLLCSLAACTVESISFTPVEDCAIAGDEDGNGAADCGDPACAAEPACLPRCDDGVQNGAEADVDCGGNCAPCTVGRACGAETDCASDSVCDGSLCRYARDCAQVLQHRPGASDGVYVILPGFGASPRGAVCDMTRDGGGWTLLLKGADDAVLQHDAALWTNTALLNATDLTTQPGNAKYETFVFLQVTTLRGELDGFRFTKTVAGLTALQVFAGAADFVSGYPTFNTGAPNWSTQPNCQSYGINIPYPTHPRFGWSANQENDCLTNDTGIGLGLNNRGAGYLCLSTLCSAGNVNAGGAGLLWGR